MIHQAEAAAVNGKSHQSLFKCLPEPVLKLRPAKKKILLARRETLECDQPCKNENRENTSDEVMQSGFVVISHHYKYRSVLEASQES